MFTLPLYVQTSVMCEGTLQIVCHISIGLTNLLAKPNQIMCFWYIEMLESNLSYFYLVSDVHI